MVKVSLEADRRARAEREELVSSLERNQVEAYILRRPQHTFQNLQAEIDRADEQR